MTAKEQKIKEVYGRHYENAKRHIRHDGSIDEIIWVNLEIDLLYRDLSTGYLQPISLKGIENNNGWIRIESEEDLPESGYYEVVVRDSGEITRATLDNEFRSKSMCKYYSHYQPIQGKQPPIY